MPKPSKKKQHISNLKKERIHKLLNIGMGFHKSQQVQLAEDAYRKVIQYDPLNFRALYLLGILFSECGNHKDGAEFMKMALEVNPGYSLAHNDMGVILQQLGDVKGAMECYKKALELNGTFSEAQNNLGVAFGQKGNAKKAMEYYKKAIEIDPYYFDAHNNYIFALDLSEDETVQSLIEERKRWSTIHEEPLLAKHKPHKNELTTDRKLRVGYVSADFRLHSASFVFGSVLEFYDKDKFEVHCYNNSNTKPDARTIFFKGAVDSWTDIFGWSDDDVATKIRQDKIDILVDLSGYSAGSRLLTFARKPAPIQACGWGYATSTGMKSMDYFFADNVIVPPEERDLYVENVIYLPNVVNHYCPEKKPDVGPLPALTKGVITFASFNRLAKISDESYAVWAEVLKQVPNSRMLFKINESDPTAAKEHIIEIFKGNGIPEDRLHFFGKTTWTQHMESFNHVDIALDPWVHTGGLTTVDNLVMGVPVITLRWPTIVGRLSASMLTTMGMTDWIAETKEEYIKLAVDKASDLSKLAEVRAGLRDKFYATPLGDCAGYCKAVEVEYIKMWEKYVADKT